MTPDRAPNAPLHFIVGGRSARQRIQECRRRAGEVTALYAGAACRIWHGKAVREQILHGFGEEVAAAFDAQPTAADAAALASWCLLHRFGGMYHASGLRLLGPMSIPADAGVAAFNDVRPSASGWAAIDGALLWSRPGRREWTLAIDMKVKAWSQPPSRPPTDPVILGRAFGLAAGERDGRGADDQSVGQVITVPGPAGAERAALVAPDGTIVALLPPS